MFLIVDWSTEACDYGITLHFAKSIRYSNCWADYSWDTVAINYRTFILQFPGAIDGVRGEEGIDQG